ncbi:hypothetical protein Scep_005005 [Stephania cephalantha]|uniref:Uncharacterized protein n=1 Tax=Stephania cephalantha TaxID=152367 RepID=A0AAP0KTQ4_9MAGN
MPLLRHLSRSIVVLFPGRHPRASSLVVLHLADASPSRLCISPTPHPRVHAPWSSSRRRLTLAPLLPGRSLGDASPSRLCSLVGELPSRPLADASPLRLCSLVAGRRLCSPVGRSASSRSSSRRCLTLAPLLPGRHLLPS